MDRNRFYPLRDQCYDGLRSLVDNEFYFYGVFNNNFKIDDMILEVIEDPEDGYRSSMGTICHYKSYEDLKVRFFDRPLGRVKLTEISNSYSNSFEGWALIDVDTNHQWLVFGTNNYDDYYPYFVFDYTPDKTQTEFVSVPSDYVPFKQNHPELVFKYSDWFGGECLEFKEY